MERVTPKFDHLTKLAKTIAVPRLHAPLRTPTFPALERTALLGFTDTGTMPINAANTGDLDVVLIRDPAFPLWITYEFPLLWSISTFMALPASGQGIAAGTQVTFVPDPSLTNISNVNVPKNLTPVIRHKNLEYLPVYSPRYSAAPFTNVIAMGIEVAATTPLAGFKYDVSLLSENFGELVVFNSSVNGAFNSSGGWSGGVTALQLGAYSGRIIGIRFSELVLAGGAALANVTSINMGVTTTDPGAAAGLLVRPLSGPTATRQNVGFMPWVLPPALADSELPYRGVRANAAAVLFSNVGKVLEKEGTVQGARVFTDSFPVFAPDAWNFAEVHPKDRYFGPLEKGVYAFSMGDATSDVFKDTVQNGLAHFNVDGFNYAICIRMRDPDTLTPSTMAVTLDRHLEFRTSSLLFNTGYSDDTLEMYHQAQIALLNTGCILENPTHLAALSSMIGKAVSAAWPVVRPYAAMAGRIAVSKAANWANNKLGAMAQAQMVTPRAQPRAKPRAKPKAKVAKRRR